ncbi:MAG: tetratricopeptide repeat protein [Candidatus Hodarchaeales archaeon]|jgi:hypothetical protein
MNDQEHSTPENLETSIPPEVRVLYDQLSQEEKKLILGLWESYLSKPLLDDSDPILRLIFAISRAEIPLTFGIINLGAFIALFQGTQGFNVFFTLTDPETSRIENNNPTIFNLLALHNLLFTGGVLESLDWITCTLDLVEKTENLPFSIRKSIQEDQIFANILSFYANSILGELREARYASEEANRLMAISQYKYELIFFWNWYFKAEVELTQHHAWDRALGYAEDGLQLATKFNHRVYQGLALQLKGRALQGKLEHVPAYHTYLKAKSMFENTNSIFLILLYSNLGDLERAVGRYSLAKKMYQRTIIEAQGIIGEAPLLQLPGLKGIADLYLIQGSYQLAKGAYERTISVCKKTNNKAMEAACLTALGGIYTDQSTSMNDFKKAQDYFMQSLALREKYGLEKTYTLLELGNLSLKQGNIPLAKIQFHILRNLAHKSRASSEINIFHALIFAKEGKIDESQEILERMQFTILSKLSDFDFKLRIQLILARIAIQEAQQEDDDIFIEEAAERINKIRSLATKPTFPSLQALFLLLDATLNWLETKNITQGIERTKLATRLAVQSNLIRVQKISEFLKRRFLRNHVKLNYSNLIKLIDELDRCVIYLSRKTLE